MCSSLLSSRSTLRLKLLVEAEVKVKAERAPPDLLITSGVLAFTVTSTIAFTIAFATAFATALPTAFTIFFKHAPWLSP